MIDHGHYKVYDEPEIQEIGRIVRECPRADFLLSAAMTAIDLGVSEALPGILATARKVAFR